MSLQSTKLLSAMKSFSLALLIFIATFISCTEHAAAGECSVSASENDKRFFSGAETCTEPASPGGAQAPAPPIDSYPRQYTRTNPLCADGATTNDGIICGANPCVAGQQWASTITYTVTAPAVDPQPGQEQSSCIGPTQAGNAPDIQAQLVSAFQQIQPEIAAPQHQPPGENTLVNFPTIFYSTVKPQDVAMNLLAHVVTLRITPISWHWSYGDGSDETTSSPGARYPNQTVTHTYAALGTYTASVDITYRGEYRLDQDGAFQAIPGTVTRTSPTATLTTLEARAELAPNPGQ